MGRLHAPLAFLAGISLLGCAAGPVRPDRPPNFVIIVVDTLRPDHLGLYGYPKETSPNLDRMARDGIVFDRAYSAAPWTYPSTVSLLTGLWPSEHGANDLKVDAETGAMTLAQAEQDWLPRRFAERGYRTAAFHTHRYLHREVSNIHEAFEEFYYPPAEGATAEELDVVGRGHWRWTDRMFLDTLYPPFEDWLTRTAGEPFFAYLHVIDVHGPYQDALVLDEDRATFERGLEDGSIVLPRMDNTEMYRPTDVENPHKSYLYDGHVRSVDAYVGRLSTHLEKLGIAKDTYLVVTSDHGEGFGEHGYWGHGHYVFDDQVRVPLVLLSHREVVRRPHRVRELVSTTGLVPTLAELAGIELPAPLAARGFANLLDERPPARRRSLVVAELQRRPGRQAYMLDPRFKLIRESSDGSERLYDLEADPGEMRPIEDATLAGEALAARRVLSRVGERYRSTLQQRPVRERTLRSEDVEALRALGYVR